jgi:hypothetical protein
MTNIPYTENGIAKFEESSSFQQLELFNGSIPQIVTEDFLVADSLTLLANSVVGLDATNKLVMAKTSATAVVPLGVTLHAITTGVGNTDRVAIYRSGNFNRDALVFHADYSTNALKEAAFRGSPTPTNIVVRGRL